jgi:sigma-B regulation protein RsbU (phosphoserine phosphatase)
MVICRSLITKEITGNTYRILAASEVLARLNAEMIRRQGQSTRFVTAVYAVVNCRSRTVQLAGAGHPPPVRLRPDGTSETLETRGGLLGVFPDEEYGHIDLELALGDRLLFYTDGFEQAFPSTAKDQHERRMPTNQYRDEFDLLGRLPNAAEMIDTINGRLDDQAGSLHQVDDLTLICVHAGPITTAMEGDGEDRQHSAAPSSRAKSRPAGQLRLAT